MIPDDLPDKLPGVLGWLAAAVAGLFVGYGKIVRTFRADEKAATADYASSEVIELLRREIVALSEQNQRLAKMVNSLQLEIIELRDDHARFLHQLGVEHRGKQTSKTTDQQR